MRRAEYSSTLEVPTNASDSRNSNHLAAEAGVAARRIFAKQRSSVPPFTAANMDHSFRLDNFKSNKQLRQTENVVAAAGLPNFKQSASLY